MKKKKMEGLTCRRKGKERVLLEKLQGERGREREGIYTEQTKGKRQKLRLPEREMDMGERLYANQ